MALGVVSLMVLILIIVLVVCRWCPRAAYNVLKQSQNLFEPDDEPSPAAPPRSAKRAYITPYLKKQIAHDQNWKCSCGCGKTLQPDFHIDHTVPLWQGGPDTTENMTAMNPQCHARKTAIENQRA